MTKLAEEPITIAGRGEGPQLEGLLSRGGPRGAVVAPPHPLYGGSISNPVVHALRSALRDAGLSTLAFNWRGVGGSHGVPSGDEQAAEADYGAALDCLAQSCDPPFIAGGYSFGAATAASLAASTPLRAGDSDATAGATFERLVMISPPAAMLAAAAARASDPHSGGAAIPWRVIVGGNDPFAPVASLRAVIAELVDARLYVIDNADHFFSGSAAAEIEALVSKALQD